MIRNSLLVFTVAILTPAEAIKTTLHANLFKEPTCGYRQEKIECYREGDNAVFMSYCTVEDKPGYFISDVQKIFPYWPHHPEWNSKKGGDDEYEGAYYCLHSNWNKRGGCKCKSWGYLSLISCQTSVIWQRPICTASNSRSLNYSEFILKF